MIRIDVKKNGFYIDEVRVTGHAGGRKGKDIVCAAVSAITQTALAGLQRYLEGSVLHEILEGLISIRIPQHVSGHEREVSQIILSTMLLGLEQIALQNPKKIRVYSDGKRMKSEPSV